ncbi:hypothetical protein N9C92_01300 [Candidatus Pelagibacter sp.]|nr:hypothetical protein [Candidatus Pelagibacter sp.]
MKKILGIIVLGLLLSGNAYAKEYNLTCKETGRISSEPLSFIFEENPNKIYVRRVTKDKVFNPLLTSKLKEKSKITWIIIAGRSNAKAAIYKFNLDLNKKNIIVFQSTLENSDFDEVKKFSLKKKKNIISEIQYIEFKEDIFSQTKHKLRDVVKKCTGSIFRKN